MEIKRPKALPEFAAPVRGRGALDNPAGRFERLDTAADAEAWEALRVAGEVDETLQLQTKVFRDTSRSIISTNDSPDVGMQASVNPYRGCEHGCIYCFARPTHEYLGLSAGLDFETQIFAKPDAPALLEAKLRSPSWQPQTVTLSGVTDCYQPLERKLRLTRACLEVLRDFRNPATIITKNFLVTRDMDVFKEMAAQQTIFVALSVTTLDTGLARAMEPRASQPALRLRAIEMLAKEKIPVGVMVGPVLPGLTEHEIPAILKAVAAAGAMTAHYTMLRLPYGVKDLFQTWLKEHFPDRAEKVLNRLRDMRGGKLYESDFETRMTGTGHYARQVADMFRLYKQQYGLTQNVPLTAKGFNRQARGRQLSLF